MNCKKGDIAVMVHSDFPLNIGALFDVVCRVRGSHPPEWRVKALTHAEWAGGIDKPGARGIAFDADLRPIRPEPGQDETLEWAGLPVTTKEEVA